MKKLLFAKAEFLAATLSHQDLPKFSDPHGNILPEIAIVGRSNVGKSSLINHLLKQKALAKTSGKPGKTQTINFFRIDDALIFVDLPGYGFAQVAHSLKQQWGASIDAYLQERSSLKLLLLLLDARREPSCEDLQIINWARNKQLPVLILLTKCDKLSDKELRERPHFHYSIKDPKARLRLIKEINSFLFSN